MRKVVFAMSPRAGKLYETFLLVTLLPVSDLSCFQVWANYKNFFVSNINSC